MRVTASDSMTTGILTEAYAEQQKAQRLFFDLIQRTVALVEPDTTEEDYTLPFPSLINVIEQNINALTADGYRPSDMENTVEWKGELNDMVRFSYRDVNRWFTSGELINALIHGIAARMLITGTFTAGGNRTRQAVRSV